MGLSHSWLWHSGCIWDLALGPVNNTQAGGQPAVFQSWPVFITCSNDDTIRTWDILSQTKSNLYSNVRPHLNALKIQLDLITSTCYWCCVGSLVYLMNEWRFYMQTIGMRGHQIHFNSTFRLPTIHFAW